MVRFQQLMAWNARERSWLSSGTIADKIGREIAELWVAKVALLTRDDKFAPQRPPVFTDVVVFRRFPFAHCDGLLVPSLCCKFECSTLCLRWLRRPWVTEIIFGARRASPVEFHGSRDAMASKSCFTSCARPRAFQKAFDHQIWTLSTKVITKILLHTRAVVKIS